MGKEGVVEASVILAKCDRAKKVYGIRIEKRINNAWYCTWAFPISEKKASNEGYDNTIISGEVFNEEEYPGCPYCGRIGWVSCGQCKKLSCWGNDRYFTCQWCGNSGEVRASDTFDLTGGGY